MPSTSRSTWWPSTWSSYWPAEVLAMTPTPGPVAPWRGRGTRYHRAPGTMGPTTQARSTRVMAFDTIEDAVDAIGRGEVVVVVDDEDRENEGDLIMAAECATAEKIAFF